VKWLHNCEEFVFLFESQKTRSIADLAFPSATYDLIVIEDSTSVLKMTAAVAKNVAPGTRRLRDSRFVPPTL
jgi:hypothetical protein